ncbi:MAG: 3-dehydroquinate synthase [Bacteroides sp.]|nr:MAG: 3-dehydroquinate synthase [Bacteroides sp.]
MNFSFIKNKDYNIYIGNNIYNYINFFIKKNNYSTIVIITDENSELYCKPILIQKTNIKQYYHIKLQSGEINKSIDNVIKAWKYMLMNKIDRNSLMINLGGGIITDIGGFIASTYKRGIDFINIPTTLLAQVDASIGSKTGINFYNIKNCIGNFQNPKSVYIDNNFLKSLTCNEILCGFAEMIKHGLIYDKIYYNELQKINHIHHDIINDILIYKSLKIKNEIVEKDINEQNIRKILNFGHTIGHAIEGLFLNHNIPISHGHAISIGMICESYLSYIRNTLLLSDLNSITNLIINKFNCQKISELLFNELINIMHNDKKNHQNKINFTLLNNIGSAKIDMYCEQFEIIDSLKFYNKKAN